MMMSSGCSDPAASLPSARPASAPPPRHSAAAVGCGRSVKASPGASAAGGGRATAAATEQDVSYGRDEVAVWREMVLVSLIEGAVRSSGVRAVLYKCHMCAGFVSSLGGLTRHMATHGSAAPGNDRHRNNSASAPAASEPCNGHTDGADLADDAATAASSMIDSSQQQQAEDLSRSTCLRRQRAAAASARRRAGEPLQCRRPSQRLAFVSSEMLEAGETTQVPSSSGGGELASEIRAKEHLDDDVTVVIPSDAPLDCVARAAASDTAAWPPAQDIRHGTVEIAHAPVKSIMGHPHVHRKARLSGSSTTDAGAVGGGSTTLKSDGAQLMTVGGADSLQQLPAAMFGPLALSTFVHGFGGLVAAASPFLSYYTAAHMPPAAAAASLASLMAVTSTPFNAPPAATHSAAAVDCSKVPEQLEDDDEKSEDSPKDGAAAGMQVDEASSNGSGSSGWTSSDPLSTGLTNPATKCSSLSRTHSRFVYLVNFDFGVSGDRWTLFFR